MRQGKAASEDQALHWYQALYVLTPAAGKRIPIRLRASSFPTALPLDRPPSVDYKTGRRPTPFRRSAFRIRSRNTCRERAEVRDDRPIWSSARRRNDRAQRAALAGSSPSALCQLRDAREASSGRALERDIALLEDKTRSRSSSASTGSTRQADVDAAADPCGGRHDRGRARGVYAGNSACSVL
jgi:hypothetical protein